ncbi:hypothetical protein S40288_00279 [Stachybotrys chartarum IBT 40288]|nr:hypothetical protein S40288_00279 [Stachybotrys chartarum IBT 40288]
MSPSGYSDASRSISRASSVYFQNSNSSSSARNPLSQSSSSSVFAQHISTSTIESRSVHTPSVASYGATSSRAPTSRPSTRPSTASGRRSRAASASSILGLSDSQSVVCAVSEARGVTPSVGVAFVNVSHGEVVLSQICDNQSYVKTIHKIQMACPSRIIFMASACPPARPSTLYSLIDDLIPEAQIEAFDRSAWSEMAGLEYISTLAFVNDIEPVKVALSGKFYATSSLAAVRAASDYALTYAHVYQVMKYVEGHFNIRFSPHSLRVRYQPSEDTMMIDISAIQSLEIMQNSRTAKSKDCLFGLLNHTATPMGSRMLRSNMLQPPTREDSFISPRHDALAELTTNEEMFREIRKSLKLFHDVEKLLTKLIILPATTDVGFVEEQISQVLMVKSFLESVSGLHKALRPAQSTLLSKVRDLCSPEITIPILGRIRRTIEADVTYMKSPLDLRNQRTFAVKSGINGMLDVARQTYKELTEEVHQHVDELNEACGVAAKLKFDNGRKYWLRIKAADIDDENIPTVLINMVRKKNDVECQTLSLVKLNLRLSDTYNEVVIRSDQVIQDLMVELRREAPHLFRICESVALVDMISSFAQLATTRDYVRPEITGTLALKAARHPILDKACN